MVKVVLLASLALLTACQMNNQTAGTVIGGGAGGLLGSTVGKTTNQRLLATGVGTLIGAAAGSAVGASMVEKQTTVQQQTVVHHQAGADVCAKYKNNEGAYSSCQKGVAKKNADEQRRLEREAYNEGLRR